MMRFSSGVCLSVLFVTLNSGCANFMPKIFGYNYPVLDTWLHEKVICGDTGCVAGQNGVPFHYTRFAWSPSVNETTTPDSVARQIIGYATVDNEGGDPRECTTQGKPGPQFGANDITPRGSKEGRKIDYTYTKALDIKVDTVVDADIKAIMLSSGLELSNPKIQAAKVKLTSAYTALNKSKATVSGRYFVYGLSPDAYRDVQSGKYPSCLQALRLESNMQLITGAGIIVFDTTYEEGSTQKLVGEVQTALKSSGITFNVGAAISRAVSENLKASMNGFQVIAVKRADASYFSSNPIAK